MQSVEDFQKKMKEDGWAVFPKFVDKKLVIQLIDDLEESYAFCRKIQIENGVENSEGTAHHLVGQAASFMACLARYEKIDSHLEAYFEGKYILNSFGGNILKKGMSYANNIHRDIRTFSGEIPLMLNTIILLDDFTEKNGATWLMDGGHKHKEKPTEDEFRKCAFQIIGNAGDMVVWNSNLWHCAGENTTHDPRRSLTPLFSKPFMKQGFGYSDLPVYSPNRYIEQVLGRNSLTPRTLDEWYQPREKRFYRDDQG